MNARKQQRPRGEVSSSSNDRRKRLRDSRGMSRKLQTAGGLADPPGPLRIALPKITDPLPFFGHLYDSHPLRPFVSNKKSLSLDRNTRVEMLSCICLQNAVVGCLVRAVWVDDEGIERDVLVRRVTLSRLADTTGVCIFP